MILMKLFGRSRKVKLQRSPVRKLSMRFSNGAAAVQRTLSLTGNTIRISRVHLSCDSVARERRVSAAWTNAAITKTSKPISEGKRPSDLRLSKASPIPYPNRLCQATRSTLVTTSSGATATSAESSGPNRTIRTCRLISLPPLRPLFRASGMLLHKRFRQNQARGLASTQTGPSLLP